MSAAMPVIVLKAAFGCLLIGLIVRLAVIDVRRMILPDRLNLALAAGGLVQALVVGEPSPIDAVLGALVAAAALGLIAAVFRYVRGIDGLGLGDQKFVAAAGLWIGWQEISGDDADRSRIGAGLRGRSSDPAAGTATVGAPAVRSVSRGRHGRDVARNHCDRLRRGERDGNGCDLRRSIKAPAQWRDVSAAPDAAPADSDGGDFEHRVRRLSCRRKSRSISRSSSGRPAPPQDR